MFSMGHILQITTSQLTKLRNVSFNLSENGWEFVSEMVTNEAVKYGISSFDRFKWLYPDDIYQAMLQESLALLILSLKAVSIACIALGYIYVVESESWFHSKSRKIWLFPTKKYVRPVSLTKDRKESHTARISILQKYPMYDKKHAYW